MKKLIVSVILICTGCVSSILKAPAPKLNKNIQLSNLPSDYERSKDTDLPAWRNTKSGVRIGVYSDCENLDARLSDAHHIVSDSLEKKIQQSDDIETIEGRKYFMKAFTGEIEASPIEVETAAFRLDDCIVLSSLSGHPGRIANHKTDWIDFLKKIEFKK